MKTWFKRGSDSEAPKAFARSVEAAAAYLPGGQQHAKEVSKYVVTGERPQVLTALGQARQQQSYGYPPLSAQLLYEHLGAVDPVAWVRWGQVLEAAYGSNQWSAPLSTAGMFPAWLEQLLGGLGDAYGTRGYGDYYSTPEQVPLSFEDVAAVAEAGDVEVPVLLDALFVASSGMEYTSSFKGRRALAGTSGFAAGITEHLDRLGGRLTSGAVEQRLLFCALVSGFDDSELAPLAPMLAVAATSTSAKVRDAAMPLLERVLPAAAPTLRRLAVEGKPDVRVSALELLWRRGTDADRDSALETAGADRTPRIRALVDASTSAPASAPIIPPELDVPDPDPIVWRVDVTPGLRACVETVARRQLEAWERHNRHAAQARTAYQKQFGSVPKHMMEMPVDRHLGEQLLADLASDRPPRPAEDPSQRHLSSYVVLEAAAHPEATPVVVVTVLAALGLLTGRGSSLGMEAVQAIEACHRRTGGPDLLTLQQMLDEMGLPGRQLVWRTVNSSWDPLARLWPDDDVWPFLARNIDFVVAHAKPADGDYLVDDSAFYRLIGTLPAQPPSVVEHLYGVALGLAKTHRPAAQHALRDHPDRARRATAALADGKSEARVVAATWLAAIADHDALPALEAAVAKEKHDVAKGAMLDALEALGRPVDAYLDRDVLAVEAEKAVAKGLPVALAWVPWERLPDLRWSDSGDRVPPVVVRHLVAQAVRGKSPEPNAILRKYAAMLDEGDRHRFAHALLASWIAADLKPISATEAHQRAHQHGSAMHSWMQQSPASFPGDPLLGKSVEELTAHYLPGMARTPAGSQAASKGVLAVVAAMGGREVVPLAERYLKDWYGQRASQGKALIAMLGWVQHPSATQLLLSIGSRFRTKTFQLEATRQVEALAEREGWTVAELGDRTISTAGFDADGRLDLSYGQRTFVARLQPDLTLQLRNEDGKVVKALPSPRQSEDADQVKAAKATFSGTKKELKSLVPLLQQRLYEALCTERTWLADDWQRFLVGHPVMRLLCQRLMWVSEAADGSRQVFRLLDDGTLSDVDDQEITLPMDGTVRLAHDSLLTRDEVEAWLGHLADYEVEPLFAQLGRGLHAVSEERRTGSSLEDFRGHSLEAFALRNRALKLGWTRGQAEDGGWFFTYAKRFPTLGLVAQLGFTGNGLPEDNRLVALLDLSFQREAPDGSDESGVALPLSDVPAILLSEIWHDVRSIAAEGSGHDPDWERKARL